MTHKRKLRGIAILITLAFLLSLLPASMAGAASGYTALQVPNVDDNKWQPLGTVLVEIPAGAIANGHSVVLSLPSDFKFIDDITNLPTAVHGSAYDQYTVAGDVYGQVRIYVPSTYQGDNNDLYDLPYKFTITLLDENQLQLTLQDYASEGNRNVFYVYLDSVFVKDGFSGDIRLSAEAPSNSGFPSGEVVVGRVPGGKVEISVPDVNSFSDSLVVKIRVKEVTAGSLEKYSDSLKLVLPSGFEWAPVSSTDITGYLTAVVDGYVYAKTIWGGDSIAFGGGSVDEDTLKIGVTNTSEKAGYFELVAKIQVSDETAVEPGDVVVKIGGKSTTNISEAVIAKYGEYGCTVEAKEAPEVFAGMLEQEIGNIVIKEAIKGSLVSGRTILLTLPSNAKWGKIDTNVSDANVSLSFAGFPGTDGRVLKYTVSGGPSSGAAELELEDMEVVLEPGVTGDLKVEVSGTAGVSGTITVAKIVAPVTMTAEAKPAVKIGLADQAAGDILIAETKAGAIAEDKIILDLPEGVKFAALPKVEVVAGDLKIDATGVTRQADGDYADNQLVIPVDRDSLTASTIKVSGIKYTVDRTVAEGDIVVKLKGVAVTDVNDLTSIKDYYGVSNVVGSRVKIEGKDAFDLSNDKIWPNSTTAAKVANATVVTPAPGEVKGTAVLVIGSTTMKVNGVDVTMDVAPYLKNSRTYVPVRFCAKALGIDENNILWDGATQTATIVAGAKVIQMKVGSKAMIVNGASVNMDTAPELVPPGRVCLPIGWLAWALGAKTSWDSATQTATLEL